MGTEIDREPLIEFLDRHPEVNTRERYTARIAKPKLDFMPGVFEGALRDFAGRSFSKKPPKGYALAVRGEKTAFIVRGAYANSEGGCELELEFDENEYGRLLRLIENLGGLRYVWKGTLLWPAGRVEALALTGVIALPQYFVKEGGRYNERSFLI